MKIKPKKTKIKPIVGWVVIPEKDKSLRRIAEDGWFYGTWKKKKELEHYIKANGMSNVRIIKVLIKPTK